MKLFRLLLLGAVLLFADAEKGWELLLQNRPDDARVIFEKIGKGEGDDAGSAWRGLAAVRKYRGDFLGSARAVVEAYRRDRNLDYLSVFIVELSTLIRQGDESIREEFRSLLADLRQNPEAAGIWAKLYGEFGFYSEISQSPDSTRRYYDELPILRHWKMAGPFDNISNAGIFRSYGPEKGFALDDEYIGLSGMQVKWLDLYGQDPDGWTFLDYHQNIDNAVNYFATSLESNKNEKALLSFGASGVFQLWFNGVPILRNEIFRNTGLDDYVFPVELKKGKNHLLVKLGHEEGTMSNFIVRMMKMDGSALRLEHVPAPQPAVQPGLPKQQSRQNPHVKNLQTKTGLEVSLTQALYRIWREDFSGAKQILYTLQKDFPESSLLESMLGDIFGRQGNFTLAEIHSNRCYRLDPSNYSGWSSHYRLLSKRQNLQKAWDFFRARDTALIVSPDQWLQHMGVAMQLEHQGDALALRDSLRLKYPRNLTVGAVLVSIYGSLGNMKVVGSIVDSLRQRFHHSAQMASLESRYASKTGDLARAVRVLEESLLRNGHSSGFLLKLSEFYLQLDDLQKSLDALDRAVRVNPYSAAIWTQRGKVLEKVGRKELALLSYRRALKLDYSDFEIADQVRNLEGKKPLIDLVQGFSLDSLAREGKKWKKGRDRNSLILLQQTSLLVLSQGAFEEVEHIVVEVLDYKGVDQWKEYQMDARSNFEKTSLLKAVSIKPDGKMVDAENSGGQLVFRNLEPGDLIDIRLLRRYYYAGALARQFWTKVLLAMGTPVLCNFFEVLTPDGNDYQVKKHLNSIPTKKDKVHDFFRSSWKVDRETGFPAEARMAPWTDALPWIQISSFKNWGQISRWYKSLTEGKTLPTRELKNLADSLFRKLSEPEEKIRAVHSFVTNEVRYSSQPFRQSGFVPQDAFKTLSTRVGDCKDMATLAKTLLQLGGVDSRLVLVKTNDEGAGEVLPSVEFNHCILSVLQGSRETFVDLTATHNGWRVLPRVDQGAHALVITGSKRDSVELLPVFNGESIHRSSIDTLDAQGNFIRHIRSVRKGHFASSFRNNARYQSPKKRRKDLLSAIRYRWPRAVLGGYESTDLNNLDADVVYSYDFREKRSAYKGAKTITMQVPWNDDLQSQSLVHEEERHYTLQDWRSNIFWGEWAHDFSLVIPEDYEIFDLPAEVELKQAGRLYRIRFVQKDGLLLGNRFLRLDRQDIEPKEYSAYKNFLNRVVENDKAMIILVRKKKP